VVFFMNHQVLQQNDEAAFGCADGEKQIDHAHDRAVASQHENAPAARLFENEPQTAKLFVLVGPKIAFLSKQFAQQSRELVQIGLGRWFNYDILAHRWLMLISKIGLTGNDAIKNRRSPRGMQLTTLCILLV